MKQSIRLSSRFAAVVLAFVVSVAMPGLAYADEGTPPTEPTPTEEVAVGATVEESSTEVTPTVEETPAPEETTVVEESPIAEDASVAESLGETEEAAPVGQTATEETVTLPALPEGTELVVLDESGEPLPLASEEAAEVISISDPQWCPVGVTPGSGSCSPSFATMSGLIAWLEDDLNDSLTDVAGVIWIHEDYDSSTATEVGFDDTVLNTFTLNGSLMGSMPDFALTIKGGWTGSGTGIDIGNKSEFDGARLVINNWNADITLSDILINNYTFNTDPALDITTAGKVTLTRVEVSNNTGDGAFIDNSSGTKDVVITSSDFDNNPFTSGLAVVSFGNITLTSVGADGNDSGADLDNDGVEGKNVTITSSHFDNNTDGQGLVVDSKGTITLSSVTANGNFDAGAVLNNSTSGFARNVTLITGTLQFNNNGAAGLTIDSTGLISLKDIDVIGNDTDGALLDNTLSPTNQGVSLTGTNIFADNIGYGIYIQSHGPVTSSNLIANSNSATGVSIDNSAGSPSPVPVTLSGTNEFKFNGAGLEVHSKGAITLNNATANDNGSSFGVYLENTFNPATPFDVTLTGTSSFLRNAGSGLQVDSYGNIKLNNVSANDNTDSGASLQNYLGDFAKLVSLTGTNTFNGNSNYGLQIDSRGVVTIASTTASDNTGDAVYVDNHYSATPLAVTFTGNLKLVGNIGGQGLTVYSRGAVTVNNIYSANNTYYGAYISNNFDADVINGYPVVAASGAVIVNGTSTFATTGGGFFYNDDHGLYIDSRGAVTLTNLDFYGNNGNGLYVDNRYGSAAGNVTLKTTIASKNIDVVDNNGNGIEIYSEGAISLTRVVATDNTAGSGAILDNSGAAMAKNVTIATSGVFSDNFGSGLVINSLGVVTLANITANSNEGFEGASIDTLGAVTLTGTNSFSDNDDDGLLIYTTAAVTTNNLTANNNAGGYGVSIDNAANPNPFAVTLNGTNSTNGNGLDGLYISTNGLVKVNQISSSGNFGKGITIDNQGSTLPQTVTLSGTNVASFNFGYGLHVLSKGTITISNLTADYNGSSNLPAHNNGSGVYLDNRFSGTGSPQNVTFTGTNNFSNNFYHGVEVRTYGMITMSNVRADSNGWGETLEADRLGFGAWLDNYTATVTPKGISITGTNSFNSNWTGGLNLNSKGNVAINNLDASFNGQVGYAGYGASIQAFLPGAIGTVTLSGHVSTEDNAESGLTVNAVKQITVANLVASGNQTSYGAILDNASGLGGVTVTGTTYASNNGTFGINIGSTGAIMVANLNASGNGSDGSNLQNTTGTAGVTITGTAITDNNITGQGLSVQTNGAITINVTDASGSDNGTNGWYLDNQTAFTPMAVTLTTVTTNSLNFDNNVGSFGLHIISHGNITVKNLDASGNGAWGASLDNAYLGATGSVTVTTTNGDSTFSDNSGDSGLLIFSNKAISVQKIVANNNGGFGALLNNTFSGSASPQNITITGSSTTDGNGDDGLRALTFGTIAVTNITAGGNGLNADPDTGWGAFLDNCYFDLGGTNICNSGGAAKPITITGTSTFNDNFQDGLWVTAYGAIKASNLSADSNDDRGVYLDNHWGVGPANAVSLTGTNVFSNNNVYGLKVSSHGAVTLNNVTATGNITGGVDILNDRLTATLVPVTLSGINNISSNMGDGLYVESDSPITINKLTASGNDGDGVYLDNTSSGPTVPQNVTINGYLISNNNGDDGLYVGTFGMITTNNLTSNNNGLNLNPFSGWGAYLDNSGASTPKPITLNGINTFSDNTQDGLVVYSYGVIKANALTATDNSYDGVQLNNQFDTFNSTVTVTGSSSFVDNDQYGLQVYSNGAITLNNLTANYNSLGGAYIDSYSLTTALVPVKLTGTNVFWDNAGTGLEVQTDSSISINNLTSGENGTGNDGSHGAYLDNTNNTGVGTPATALRTITLTGINTFYNNAGLGLGFESLGNVILNKFTADTNAFAGVSGDANTANITIACGSMTNNGGQGLELTSSGVITLKGVYSTGNGFADSYPGSQPIVTRTC